MSKKDRISRPAKLDWNYYVEELQVEGHWDDNEWMAATQRNTISLHILVSLCRKSNEREVVHVHTMFFEVLIEKFPPPLAAWV